MLCKYLLHLFNPKLKKQKNCHFQTCFLEGTWCLSLKPTFRGHTDGPAVAPGHRFALCVESVPISICRIMWKSHFHPTNLKCDTGDLVMYLGSFQCFFPLPISSKNQPLFEEQMNVRSYWKIYY